MCLNSYNILPCHIVLCTLCVSFIPNSLIKVTISLMSYCELRGLLVYDKHKYKKLSLFQV